MPALLAPGQLQKKKNYNNLRDLIFSVFQTLMALIQFCGPELQWDQQLVAPITYELPATQMTV